MKVTVVIPCYRSEATIAEVVQLTRMELHGGGYACDFVLVNDASPDGTFRVIEDLCAAHDDVMGVDCAKNLGQHAALMAGLNFVDGDVALLMDDDMQTHPSQCLKLVDAIAEDESLDVVFAEWTEHREAWWRRMGSNFATWSMRVMTGRPKDIYPSNYLVVRKHIVDEVVRYTGPYPYVQGLLFRSTNRMANVEVEHFERQVGTSGYTFKSLLRLWASVLGFSMLPLRAASIVGAAIGVLGFVAAIVVMIMRALDPTMQLGWPSLMCTILVCSGLILMFLGIIGEYLGRLFMTANNAPQYILKRVVGARGEQVRNADEKWE